MPRDDVRGMSGAGFVARWQRRTAALFRTPDLEREMAEEMRLHIELEAQEIARTRGLSASDALHQARLAFGSTERFKEEGRDARGTRWLEYVARERICRAVREWRFAFGISASPR